MDGRRRGRARHGGRAAALRATAVALAAAALSLSACGGGSDSSGTTGAPADAGLRVEVTPPRAAPGDTVNARVVNDSQETFTYGRDYSLELQEGDSFVKVGSPGIVPEIGLVAKPGETGPPVPVRIPEDALPGQYRIVIQKDVPDVGDLSGELAVTSGD
jgi:hypothetical protein